MQHHILQLWRGTGPETAVNFKHEITFMHAGDTARRNGTGHGKSRKLVTDHTTSGLGDLSTFA